MGKEYNLASRRIWISNIFVSFHVWVSKDKLDLLDRHWFMISLSIIMVNESHRAKSEPETEKENWHSNFGNSESNNFWECLHYYWNVQKMKKQNWHAYKNASLNDFMIFFVSSRCRQLSFMILFKTRIFSAFVSGDANCPNVANNSQRHSTKHCVWTCWL